MCNTAKTELLLLTIQVLRKVFAGTLLYHDVCALTSLPKVGIPQSMLCRHAVHRCVCYARVLKSLSNSASQETELLAAGFPCIDVSRAGLRQGLQGKVRHQWCIHTHLSHTGVTTQPMWLVSHPCVVHNTTASLQSYPGTEQFCFLMQKALDFTFRSSNSRLQTSLHVPANRTVILLCLMS